jgi:predicted membrane chloride channel (bestrophin family)
MVNLFTAASQLGMLPGYFPNVALAAAEPFQNSCFALSLMLVFRTNSSYARWAEARCLWGSLVNRSRNLVRQVPSVLDIVVISQRTTKLVLLTHAVHQGWLAMNSVEHLSHCTFVLSMQSQVLCTLANSKTLVRRMALFKCH